MNTLVLLTFAAGALLGLGRGIDLAFCTDLPSGLCTVGPVWLRYAALAACVLLGLAAGRRAPAHPLALRVRCPLAGVLALCAGAAMVLAVGLDGGLVRMVLEALCAAWMAVLGRAWLRGGEWKAPAGSLWLALLGSAVFYWCVLARFMENSSSWYRPAETAMVWQYLAALVFLAALARALYIPGASNGKALASSGLCAFVLCLCWQLPQSAARLAQAAEGAAAGTMGAGMGLALCFIGALGGVCAALSLRRAR